jgi:hypothetical protein
MPRCRHYQHCTGPTGALNSLPRCGELYRRRYCHARYRDCAIYQTIETYGIEAVPGDMYPFQNDRVRSAGRGGSASGFAA